MRTDEAGRPCPATLGEYRKLCAAVGGENNAAVALLDEKIANSEKGAEELVLAPDSQMREILMPMLLKPKDL